MHPYRDRSEARFPASANAAALRRGRWSARAAVLPLGAIFCAFFMPAIRGCQGDEVPMVEGFRDARSMMWILPTYVVAAILATLLAVAALTRRTPLSPSRRIAEGAILVHAVCTFAFTLGYLLPENEKGWVLAVNLASPVMGTVLLVVGHGMRGWRRWGFLLAAYTALAGQIGFIFLWYLTSLDALLVGGRVFAVSYVLLVIASVFAIWPGRRRPSSPAVPVR